MGNGPGGEGSLAVREPESAGLLARTTEMERLFHRAKGGLFLSPGDGGESSGGIGLGSVK